MPSDTEVIGKIEKMIRMKLSPLTEENLRAGTNGFLLDDDGRVTGLNIISCGFSDILPLQSLTEMYRLNLGNNKITDIAPLLLLTQMRELYLYDNQITDISPLQTLSQVNTLWLNNNQITDISPLQTFTQVKDLNLSFNQITDISPLQTFTQVKDLNLSFNQITDISPLQTLTQVKELYLHNNQITDISPLQTLTQVKTLSLFNNQITDISPLQTFTQVNSLWLNNNQITDISPLQTLTQVKELYLHNNQITDISPLQTFTQLETLDLSSNRITHLPPVITQWSMPIAYKEKWLNGYFNLYDNPLELPPVEIVRKGSQAVRNYFAELQEDSVQLLQAKLLIVGGGEVGKTTLMRKLMDNNYQVIEGNEPTTHGININDWDLDCTPCGDHEPSKVTLHFWDFGGQDIYLSTHQFFLTKRSLYLLVWEARKEEETRSFDYWLNIIRLLSDNSPVIIVMNKAEIRSKPLDEAAFTEKFPNIKGFLKISCVKGTGIAELTTEIANVLGGMPHLKDKLPKKWLELRNRLTEEKTKHKKNYIDARRYYEICSRFGLDTERADRVGDYLHDLGALLRFRHDPILKHTIIVNPSWVTKAVYALIDAPSIQDNNGRFQLEDLEKIWDANEYPRSKHRELIRLMETFEMCFKFTDTDTYIIPELVPSQRPGMDIDAYRAPGNLGFQYTYEFMPQGIVSRFIARNYHLIKNENYWKNGVELYFETASALVMGDPFNRELKIWVTGDDKRELLAIIRNELNRIHGKMNMKKSEGHYREEVPCICTTCRASNDPHLFLLDVLKKVAERKKTMLCLRSYEDISPQDLLKGQAGPRPEETLLKTFLVVAAQLQGKAAAIKPEENNRTTVLGQNLQIRGFDVHEQVLWGRSESGKGMGELDLKIDEQDGKPQAVVEAFNLTYLNKTVISNHLCKVFGYDVNGLPINFILVYVDTGDFNVLWKKYTDYLPEITYPFPLINSPREETTDYTDIKCVCTRHSRNEEETRLYHLFINMSGKKD